MRRRDDAGAGRDPGARAGGGANGELKAAMQYMSQFKSIAASFKLSK